MGAGTCGETWPPLEAEMRIYFPILKGSRTGSGKTKPASTLSFSIAIPKLIWNKILTYVVSLYTPSFNTNIILQGAHNAYLY